MTKIKLCGLSRIQDIEAANALKPDYIGFVFAPRSRRYVSPKRAAALKWALSPEIRTVGVFVDEKPEIVANLLACGIIDIAQLHGGEDEDYIHTLRALSGKPIIKAFRIDTAQDIASAQASPADLVLLDAGNGGTGTVFDWNLTDRISRPYFLAGGLDCGNIGGAIEKLKPYAVDVSSGIETGGLKDRNKMTEFVQIVRKVDSQ